MTVEGERDGVIIPPAVEHGGDDPGGKSPQEIENDITDTRARLGAILDEFERQLAPRHLLERGVDMLKNTMSGDGGRLGETVRSHPVPLALIGVGLGWLVVAATRGGGTGAPGAWRERASGAVQEGAERADAVAGQAREKVAQTSPGGETSGRGYSTASADYAYAREKSEEAADQARQSAGTARAKAETARRRVQEAGSAAWGKASDYAARTGEQLGGARDRMSELFEEYPLLMGALCFAAGAALALALPRSDAEVRLVGDVGERLREQAASLGREAADRAQHAAERTLDAATDAVKEAVSGAERHASAGASASEAGEKEHVAASMSSAGKGESRL